MERRAFLRGLGAVACSAAAHPFLSTVTLAQGAPALGENRLVVVILRGAMDGLDVLQPRGDAGFARLRPTLSASPRCRWTGSSICTTRCRVWCPCGRRARWPLSTRPAPPTATSAAISTGRTCWRRAPAWTWR